MDPRIVHVASELDVSLERTAENEGNLEFILDVIAAVDYANEMVSGEAPAAPITFDSPPMPVFRFNPCRYCVLFGVRRAL